MCCRAKILPREMQKGAKPPFAALFPSLRHHLRFEKRAQTIDFYCLFYFRASTNYFMGFWGGAFYNVKNQNMNSDNVLPHISDSVVKNGKEFTLPLNDLYYFPGFVEPEYVVVAGFRLNAMNEEANIKAYLGSGDITYASSKNLYLSAADYNSNGASEQVVSTQVTHLYKFALDNGDVNFNKAGEVPGTVLNSFSMDEHDGYFRIATTVDQWIQSGDTRQFSDLE